MTESYKICFHVMDLVGPQNACIGLAQILQQRGHQIVFLINEQFAHRFDKYGFTEVLLKEDEERLKQNAEANPIEKVSQDLKKCGLLSNMSSLEKGKQMAKVDFFESVYNKSVDFEPQLKTFLEAEMPNLIIVDSYIVAPCLINSNIPWIYLFCSNPLGLFDDDNLPPFTSGIFFC